MKPGRYRHPLLPLAASLTLLYCSFHDSLYQPAHTPTLCRKFYTGGKKHLICLYFFKGKCYKPEDRLSDRKN